MAVEAERLEITAAAAKTQYFIGDNLDTAGLEVTVYYNNGTSAVITPDSITGFDPLTSSLQPIAVSYAGLTAFYYVNVSVEYTLGDVDNNGRVNSVDVLMVLQYSTMKIELTQTQLLAADVTGDGNVNAADALRILKFVTGKVSSLA